MSAERQSLLVLVPRCWRRPCYRKKQKALAAEVQQGHSMSYLRTIGHISSRCLMGPSPTGRTTFPNRNASRPGTVEPGAPNHHPHRRRTVPSPLRYSRPPPCYLRSPRTSSRRRRSHTWRSSVRCPRGQWTHDCGTLPAPWQTSFRSTGREPCASDHRRQPLVYYHGGGPMSSVFLAFQRTGMGQRVDPGFAGRAGQLVPHRDASVSLLRLGGSSYRSAEAGVSGIRSRCWAFATR